MNKDLRKYLETVAKAAALVLLTALIGCGGFILLPGPGTGPRVQGVYPADASPNIPVNVTVQATFDKPMDPASINESTFTLSPTGAVVTPSIKAVEGTVSYFAATRTAVLAPAADLSQFTFYTATVSGEVKDTSGNTMGADYTWQFRTADLVAPDVASTDPSDGETDVEDVPEVTVTFTEDVNEDTVDGSSFRVIRGAEQVTGSVGASGDVATFTPAADLECSKTYTGLVTTAIEDLDGNPLASNYAWTWTMAPGRWLKSYDAAGDKEVAFAMDETTDGGYIIAGSGDDTIGPFDSGLIIKLDASGDPEWQRIVGGATNHDWFSSVEQTADGGYIAAGQTSSFGAGSYDMWVVKFDANGNIEWENAYGSANSEAAFEVQQTLIGGYIVGGYTDLGANREGWVVELNALGTVLQEYTYGTAGPNEELNSIQQLSDGSYVAAGYTASPNPAGDYWVLKLKTDFTVDWSYSYQGGASQDVATSVRAITGGDYLVAGYTLSFGAGGYDMWFLRLLSNGTIQYESSYGGAGNDFAMAVRPTSDGGSLLIGSTQSFGLIRDDAWLLKLGAGGNIEWENRYGNAGFGDNAYSALETAQGGYIAVGRYENPVTSIHDAWVLNLDTIGNVDAACTLITPTAAIQNASGTAAAALPVVRASLGVITTPTAATVVETTGVDETECASACSPLAP